MAKGFGSKIKHYRIKANMTQEKLSKGIISVSYLSKLESGGVTATKEIKDLLCKKLDINPIFLEDDRMQELCRAWFKHLLHREIKESTVLYNKIKENIKYITDRRLLHLFEIHKLFYFLITKNTEEADTQYLKLKKQSKYFKGNVIYYWLRASGDYNFDRLAYSEALNLYQEAEKNINLEKINFPEEEEHDLNYLIAITASKLRKTFISIVYAKKALNYYRSTYKLKRCAECHILIGISYQRTYEYDLAIENYKFAATIAKDVNDGIILALSYQNIGKLYSLMNKSDLSIDFYLKSYKLRENESINKKIIPISSLMKEYYKKRDNTNAEKWLEKGLTLSKSLSPSDSIYVYEFKVYSHLIKGYSQSFETLLTKEVLPFLDERKLDYEKSLYLKILADYYFNTRKYKLSATKYYQAHKILGTFHSE